jgi:hypothetical protein
VVLRVVGPVVEHSCSLAKILEDRASSEYPEVEEIENVFVETENMWNNKVSRLRKN